MEELSYGSTLPTGSLHVLNHVIVPLRSLGNIGQNDGFFLRPWHQHETLREIEPLKWVKLRR